MSDSNAPAAVTAPAAPAQPEAKPAQPAPAQIDVAALNAKLERYQQQLAGANAFYEAAKAAGYKSAEDFKKAATQPPATEQPVNPSVDGTVAPNLEGVLSQVGSVVDVRLAERDHRLAIEAEQKLVEDAVSKLLPQNADAYQKRLIEKAVRKEFDDARSASFYPAGHPLADSYYKPLSPDFVGKLVSDLSGLKSQSAGAKAAAIADAAMRPLPQTPPGHGQGAPALNPNNPNTPRTKEAVRAEAMDFFRQRMQAAS